ncbi:hypothetical protein Ahy_B01g051767 isoform C [Arachis hypogaea]|uniref:Uncharacterized protein n=1 Tax=Arachis hypogaea TaxID=3818 RepID=A0A445AMQ7_ARAHY|nr:hypothetical protein Ahy_B01g051767 isoform C [Arachis hypogaea]
MSSWLVATRGRQRSKRLDVELDNSIKKSIRRRKKNTPPTYQKKFHKSLVRNSHSLDKELQL